LREWRRTGSPKRSSTKNWKGQDGGEDWRKPTTTTTTTNNNNNLTANTDMTMFQNQKKQIMKVGLTHFGTNQCKMAEIFLTINRTS
jgi:hypothetical protein